MPKLGVVSVVTATNTVSMIEKSDLNTNKWFPIETLDWLEQYRKTSGEPALPD